MRKFATLKWIFVIVLLITLILNASIVFTVHAEDSDAKQKVVRVGWFDSSFCYYDQHGRRCGIDYEYQHRISAYTGWTYEYVEDSWPNLLQMLMNGEIDLLSDVSYKPERADFMFFPDLPMGTEAYYIYIDAQNSSITAENLSSFNGKRIGVNQGSVQEEFLRDWAERNHISIEIIPMVVDEDESMDMVTRGEIDGFTSIYTFSSEQKVVPVSRVGSSDYYYAVNKNRPDLLAELNMALAGIQDEDPYFNQRMSEERLYNTRTNAYLSPDQEDWIQNHGPVRIGYRDNYLPFCQSDKATGELTGAL
ncbi:MAG: transporter substrate-binding domain-containing protein, partial [Parasporobacterium sp.]|nr:transporter substrate-binding domain-containing protein [Parasporobacterium sp.]